MPKTVVTRYLQKVSAGATKHGQSPPFFVYPLGMGHDPLFKRFFHEFLRDFLELFYPDMAAQL